MAKKYLIIGSGGQVGQALKVVLGSQAILVGRNILDLSKPLELAPRILEMKPDVVINAAAYTQVDKAESEEALAHVVNAEAPLEIAKACHKLGASYVTYSTDYVYSGLDLEPWKEIDPIDPQNAYGRTKAAGEKLLIDWAPKDFKFLNLRTSWVYSFAGKNFVLTMLKLAAEREELKVVSDQVGAPTYAPHLALATVAMIEKLELDSKISGIYNCAGGGETSWFQFAEEIFKLARAQGFDLKVKNIHPIATVDFVTPASRPRNSRLNQSRLRERFDIALPDWQMGLQECFRNIIQEKGAK